MAWKTTLVNPVFACIDNASSPLAVIGIPLDHTGTYRPGTRFAPQKIREATCNLEIYSLMANLDLEEIGFRDYGDILLQPGEPRKAVERIELVTRNLFEEHREFTIILGGEHLLTYPVIRALGSKIDTLIVFDAHLDTRNEYIESQLNHATFLRRLTEEKDINVIHIGSRAYSKGELDYAKKKNIKVFNTLDVHNGRVKIEELGRVYISVDMDVFDPSIAPGVGNPEPLGITPLQFMNILREVFDKSSRVYAIDIVEVNPLVDHGDITSTLAAKIALEASGLYLEHRRSSI